MTEQTFAQKVDKLLSGKAPEESLEGMPVLKNLKKLDLSNNALTDISALSANDTLVVLNLANNGIKDVKVLEPLFNMKIAELHLEGNPIVDTPENLALIFENMPELMRIDEVNRWSVNGNGQEDDEDDSEEETDSEVDADESAGLAVLQQSGELDDDEEDYEPEDENEEDEDFDDEEESGSEGDDGEGDDGEEENVVDLKKAKKRNNDAAAEEGDAEVVEKKARNGDHA